MVYSKTQKGYRLLDLDSNQFCISRDVTFMEHVFPFKKDAMDAKNIEVFVEHIHPLIYLEETL